MGRQITITTNLPREIVDITEQLQRQVDDSAGLLHVFVKHTTCALTTADLDSGGTDEDYLAAIEAMTPEISFNHPHDPHHMPDHLWASFIGPSISVPVKEGHLQLGTWQRIVLIELSGPRDRTLYLTQLAIND